jgi:tetratricopeptide (TPR) repeat protein
MAALGGALRKYVTFSMLILLGVGLCLSGRLAAESALEPFRRGYALEQAGRHAQALREYGQAVKLTQGPLAGRIARQMGNSYYHLGLSAHAKTSYEFYLRHFPQDVKVRALVERPPCAKLNETVSSPEF